MSLNELLYLFVTQSAHPMSKKCLNCQEEIEGRTDKKFCDAYCRSSFNNKQRAHEDAQTKYIQNKLKKNLRILNQLNPDGKVTVKREKLLVEGFDFKYITHYHTTKNGATYFFCFHQGYLQLDDQRVLLVTQKD